MRNFASKFFVLLLVVTNLRGSLGYIFRFGDPESSSTYSERPVEFFIFWNILIWLMLILVVYKTRNISKKYLAIYLVSIIFSFICISQTKTFYVLATARSIFLYGFFFLCLYSARSWIKISQINKAIELMTAFGIVFLLYQIYQYNYFGILPAHSHLGIGIRYGSFYDDSLVLGILLPMFAGYFLNKYQKTFPTLVTSLVIGLVVILTGSITAIVAVFLYIVWKQRKRYGLLLFFLCVSSVSAIYFSNQIKYMWLSKTASIAAHLAGWDSFKDIGLLNLIGFSPLSHFVESGYLSFLYNFGIPILVIVLVFHFATLKACHLILKSRTSSKEMQNFAGAVEGLTISVLFANFNLPPIVYPPVYLLVAIFSAMVLNPQRYNTTVTSPIVSSKPRMN